MSESGLYDVDISNSEFKLVMGLGIKHPDELGTYSALFTLDIEEKVPDDSIFSQVQIYGFYKRLGENRSYQVGGNRKHNYLGTIISCELTFL